MPDAVWRTKHRSRGVAMVAPVKVGAGGVALLVGNGLIKEHQTRDRKAVGEACLAALEQWSMGRGGDFGSRLRKHQGGCV